MATNRVFRIRESLLSILLINLIYVQNVSIAVSIPGLFNTGVDSAGVVLPWQAVDPHYSMSGAASVPYVVRQAGTPGGLWYWADPPAGVNWIGPNSTDNLYPNDPVGDYFYRLTFDLTGLDHSLAQVAGYWGTDNTGRILLNGQATSFSKDQFGFINFEAFLLTGGFQPGINTLEFVVNNSSGPSGLLVGGLVGAVGETLAVPQIPPTTPGGPRPGGGVSGGVSVPDAGSTALLLMMFLILVQTGRICSRTRLLHNQPVAASSIAS